LVPDWNRTISFYLSINLEAQTVVAQTIALTNHRSGDPLKKMKRGGDMLVMLVRVALTEIRMIWLFQILYVLWQAYRHDVLPLVRRRAKLSLSRSNPQDATLAILETIASRSSRR
jgi:hypothetical protein